jgi:hypothetical protein
MNKTLVNAAIAAAAALMWGVGPVHGTAADGTGVEAPAPSRPARAAPGAGGAQSQPRRFNPRIMVVVPETLLGRPRAPDPAGETELIRRMVEARLQVLDASEVARIRYSAEMGHIIKEADIAAMRALCTRYHCDVFVAGEAFSEQVTSQPSQVAGPISARARIEVKAFIVDTGEILAANAAVDGATDQTPAIAAKTALQNAAAKLADYMVPRIQAAIAEGRIAPPVLVTPWRAENPPYLLYGALAGMGFLVVAAMVLAAVAHRRRLACQQAQAAEAQKRTDPTLTGETYVRDKP